MEALLREGSYRIKKDNKSLTRRGGAPSGAAAFIAIGGMGVSTPIFDYREIVLIPVIEKNSAFIKKPEKI
ncbi:MAG: hypothetical protein WC593_00150 [Methanoregula sp.]